MSNLRGLPIVLSGPSGCGKGMIVKSLLARYGERFALSVSATTRQPRPGEVDGRDYSFVTKEDFLSMIDKGEILEHTVYAGNYYGTPKAEIDRRCAEGHNVILEIETEGAMNVRRLCADAVLVFILPPSKDILEQRLRGRGTETDEVIARRLEKAQKEIPLATFYDYIVVNEEGKIDEAADTIASIVISEQHRAARLSGLAEHFYD